MRIHNFCSSCGLCTASPNNKCPSCNNNLTPVGFIDGRKLAKMSPKQRALWVENKIGHSIPQNLSDKREVYCQDIIMKHKQKNAEEQKLSSEESFQQFQYNQIHAPKCPYCQSINLSKIGIVNRAVSVGTFGLASKKIGKQWHCNNCNSDF